MVSRERVAVGIALVLIAGSATSAGVLLTRRSGRPPANALSVITLKFHLIHKLGEPIACVAPAEKAFGRQGGAQFWWDRVDHDSEEVRAIIDELGPRPARISPKEIELFYLVHQQLEAIKLSAAHGGYRFHVNLTRPPSSPNQESREISGFISYRGRIDVRKDVEARPPFGCPAGVRPEP